MSPGALFFATLLSAAAQDAALPLFRSNDLLELTIETDFGGRSFDFSNDESIEEYQPTVQAILSAVETIFTEASPASAVAEIIFSAVTDGTSTLRYPAAGGAEDFLANRAAADDATFVAEMKSQMGL